MRLHAFDHIQSVESLDGGLVRVVAVLPYESYEEIIELTESVIHAARFLRTRSRVSQAMAAGRRLNIINEKLTHVP